MKQRAYLASPFGFSEGAKLFMERVYVPRLAEVVDIINPWLLTSDAEIHQSFRDGKVAEFRHEIGKRNADGIQRADIVIAALDGQELDSGTVAEVGYAAGLGKPVYGYRNDIRQAGELQATFNLQVEYFIHSSGGVIVQSLDELVAVMANLDSSLQNSVARGLRSDHEIESTDSDLNVSDSLPGLADFLFEVGILAKTPRSFTFLLGSGQQSVAEHINRMSYVGLVLATMNGEADVGKVIEMCLLHDLAEARTSDLNYVYQKYVESNEEKVISEIADSVSFGKRMLAVLREYKQRETIEAKLAKDADNIEFILSLKEQIDTGNTRAETWMPPALKRLKTSEGQRLAEVIVKTSSDDWWFGNKDDDWWINRKGMDHTKRF